MHLRQFLSLTEVLFGKQREIEVRRENHNYGRSSSPRSTLDGRRIRGNSFSSLLLCPSFESPREILYRDE